MRTTSSTIAAVMAAVLGCASEPEDLHQREPDAELVSTITRELASVKISRASDVERTVKHAAAAPRSIVFVHVSWAFMEQQRFLYCKFALEWFRRYPHRPIAFHYIDCTPIDRGYGPLRDLPGWKELEREAGTSLVHGWGELVWIENGRVVAVERPLDHGSPGKLVARTRQLF